MGTCLLSVLNLLESVLPIFFRPPVFSKLTLLSEPCPRCGGTCSFVGTFGLVCERAGLKRIATCPTTTVDLGVLVE
jgi:hypothetical protein